MDYQWTKLNPFGYHVTNIALHLANTILVFILCLGITNNMISAIFITLLFGIHPTRVESVAWITERKDVLYLFWEHNLKLILQGHLHFLEEIYLNEQVHFITAGAVSGRWWKNRPESNPEEGFLMIYVNGEDIDYDYIDYGWVPDLD